jgi:parvulin-like peptidyl-prolyl isomerase
MRQKIVLNEARKIKKILWRLGFGIFIFLFFSACQKPQPPKEDAVARVGSEVLTVSDIVNNIPRQFRRRISNSEVQDYVVRWIDSQILYQEAKRRQLDLSEAVRRELRRLERELAIEALLEQELNKSFAVREQEIEKYYNENSQTFTRNADEVHVQYFKVGDKKTADSLTAALRRGGDFLRAARHFAGPDSSGADLFLTAEETPPVVMSAVFTIMPGAIARPIELDNGFHIFKMIEKFAAGSLRPLEQVRGEIMVKIQSEKRQERYKQLLAELKNSTPVEKNFSLLQHISLDSISTVSEQE